MPTVLIPPYVTVGAVSQGLRQEYGTVSLRRHPTLWPLRRHPTFMPPCGVTLPYAPCDVTLPLCPLGCVVTLPYAPLTHPRILTVATAPVFALIGCSFRRKTPDTTKHAGADHVASW